MADITGMSDAELEAALGMSKADFMRTSTGAAPEAAGLSREDFLRARAAATPPGQPMSSGRLPATAQPQTAQEASGPNWRSTGLGAMQGASMNFADEAIGGINAGIDYLTGQAPDGIAAAYQSRRDDARARFKEAETAAPGSFLAGQVVGGLGTIPFAPGAAGIAGGMRTGAAYGAIAGTGAGEGAADSALKAAGGAAVGGALGAAVPAAIGGGQWAYGKARDAIAGGAGMVRGAINPEAEAARRVQGALARDAAISGPADDAAFAAAQARGQPAVVADMGGDTTRALARSAANTSPEARQVLTNAASERFETQGPRVVEFLQGLVGTKGDPELAREALQSQARRVNRPAYAKAEAQGQSLWDDTLAQMSSAPAMQQAIREATRRSGNKAAAEGGTATPNPFSIGPDGAVAIKEGVTPSLKFWQVVKEGLDDQHTSLTRSGNRGEAADVDALRKGLLSHLDAQVPAYREARAGAAKFFGAEDALDAGQKFVSSPMNNNEARRAWARMSEPERTLFADGFTSRLMDDISRVGDRRDVVNRIWGTPRARERIEIALGKEKSNELRAFLGIESTMDQLRTAVAGNSTTARQLMELGLAGGAAGASALSGNSSPESVAHGAMIFGLTKGKMAIDGRVARKVADMLVSSDPAIVQQAARMAAKNPRLMQAVEAAGDNVTKALSGVTSDQLAQPLSVTVKPYLGMRSGAASEQDDRYRR